MNYQKNIESIFVKICEITVYPSSILEKVLTLVSIIQFYLVNLNSSHIFSSKIITSIIPV